MIGLTDDMGGVFLLNGRKKRVLERMATSCQVKICQSKAGKNNSPNSHVLMFCVLPAHVFFSCFDRGFLVFLCFCPHEPEAARVSLPLTARPVPQSLGGRTIDRLLQGITGIWVHSLQYTWTRLHDPRKKTGVPIFPRYELRLQIS